MKSKVEFYKAFFEELEKKGFGVDKPSSPDYVVDILFKGSVVDQIGNMIRFAKSQQIYPYRALSEWGE